MNLCGCSLSEDTQHLRIKSCSKNCFCGTVFGMALGITLKYIFPISVFREPECNN